MGVVRGSRSPHAAGPIVDPIWNDGSLDPIWIVVSLQFVVAGLRWVEVRSRTRGTLGPWSKMERAPCRFLVGLSCGGTTTTAYVLLMEMVNRRHRLWMSSIGKIHGGRGGVGQWSDQWSFAAGWPVAFAMMSLLAYVTADWRVLAMVTNLAGLPALALIL